MAKNSPMIAYTSEMYRIPLKVGDRNTHITVKMALEFKNKRELFAWLLTKKNFEYFHNGMQLNVNTLANIWTL